MSQRPPDNFDDAPVAPLNSDAANGHAPNGHAPDGHVETTQTNGTVTNGFRLGAAPNTIARGTSPTVEVVDAQVVDAQVVDAPEPIEAAPLEDDLEAPVLDESSFDDGIFNRNSTLEEANDYDEADSFDADDEVEGFEPATDLLETSDTDYDFEPELETAAELAPLASGGSSGPPSYYDDGANAGGFESPASRDQELGLMDHLRELRQRMLRCALAIGVMMVATWQYRDALLGWFAAPIVKVLQAHNGVLTTTNPMDGFMLYIQITFIAALLLAMPVLIYQMWAFIEPALTHHERRYTIIIVPFAVLLFVLGCWLGFYLSPLFFKFLIEYTPPGSRSFWTYSDTAIFLAKMLLCFGISFQVPVVTIFLNKTGLVSRNLLIENWRYAVVIIFVVVAIITPTWDPVTLCAASLPPCVLYVFSIWLVKWL